MSIVIFTMNIRDFFLHATYIIARVSKAEVKEKTNMLAMFVAAQKA